MSRPKRTWPRRIVAITLAGAVVVPTLIAAGWAATSTRETLVAIEGHRRGVEYLQPLTRLLATLVAGQSAAVASEQFDHSEVLTAVAAVENADREFAEPRGAGQRWVELRGRIDVVVDSGARNEEAYRQWSEVVELTRELAIRVADSAGLVLQPELDTYYLVDTGLIGLSQVIIDSGRLNDRITLAGARPDANQTLSISVLRDRLAATAAGVNTGLGRMLDVTQNSQVGTALLAPLDAFGAAVDALAPSTDLVANPPQPENVPVAVFGVRAASVQLADAIWGELDRMLAEREGGQQGRLWLLALTVVVQVLLAVAMVLLVWGRSRANPLGPGPNRRLPTQGRDGVTTEAYRPTEVLRATAGQR